MSLFDLVPQDGGAPVHLPAGETPLGRGPLLGISDKRVSRHHAVLDATSGRLRLKSTHVNPCFLQSSLDHDPRPLDKDCWVSLSPGDFLSLLPGRFLYQVVAVGGAADTLREASSSEEPSGPGQTSERSRVSGKETSATAVSKTPLKQTSPPGGAAASPVLPVREKRVLPAWMMKAVTPPTASPTAAKKRKEPVAVSKKDTPPPSPVEAGLSEEEEEQRPRKKTRISKDSPGTFSSTSPRLDEGQCEPGDDVTMKEEGWAMVIDRRTVQEPANGEPSPARAAASKPTAARTACPYGSSCYRKNPAHFQECSHPGDPDFQEEEEEDPAQLPECPYGTDCYRKNPLHRKEFKHTRRPARSTRTASRNPANEDDDDDDEDEYESSFIDDSDEGDGDSDYVPAGSDDDGEDMRQLQSEARDFLKKRK